MTDRYERIRRALAMGPTPGEWYWSDAYPTQDGRKTWSLIGDGGFGILSCDGEENSPQSVNPAAAEFITACDPDTIQALLDECDALRGEVAEWKSVAVAQSTEIERLAKALKAYQMGLRYAVRVWVLSDEIVWSEETIDDAVENIIDNAKKEAGND